MGRPAAQISGVTTAAGLRAAGLSRGQVERRDRRPGDFLWRQHRTIAEADGVIKYTGPAKALAQLNRDTRLREAGFEVVHITWPEITRVPGQVVHAIRAAFRRGGGTRRE